MRYIKSYKISDVDIFGIDVTPVPFSSFIYSYIIKNKTYEDRCLVVDPGPASSVDYLVRIIKKLNCEKLDVLLTHIHIDHSGSTGHLSLFFKDRLKAYVHPKGMPHLIDPERLWKSSNEVLGTLAEIYQRPISLDSELIYQTSDKEEAIINGIRLVFIHTPGHASHHQSILLQEHGLLFPGEASGLYIEEQDASLIAAPPPFIYDIYMTSLERLMNLQPSLLALPHNTVVQSSAHFTRHLEQLSLWKKISTVETFEEFIQKIRNEDLNIARLLSTDDKMIIENVKLNLLGAYQAFHTSH